MQNASKDKELPGRCQKHAASRPGGHDFQQRMFLQAKALIIKTNTYQNKYLPQDGMPDGNPFRDRRDVLLKRIQINVLRARKAKKGALF